MMLISKPRPVAATDRRGPIPFRLRVGVTGHRELSDLDELRRSVSSVLDEVVDRLCVTRTPVVYRAVSPLAEGADRLVAHAVLDRPGADLVVFLPFARERYLEDFRTAVSQLEFNELYSRAVFHRVVTDDGHLSNDEHYARVGQDVVDHADVLIALWNGLPAKGVGGTASIVSYARGESPDEDPGDDRGRRIPVFVVRTDPAGELHRRFEDCDWDALEKAYRHLDYFNHFQPPRRGYSRALLRNRYELRAPLDRLRSEDTGESVAGRSSEIAALLEEWILPAFCRADTGAASFRNQVLRIGVGTALFAALAVIVAAARVVLWPRASSLTWTEVALMASVLAGRFLLMRRRAHARWLSFRALAEWLRVMPYIALAGRSDLAERNLTGPRESEVVRPPIVQLEWYRRAVEELWRRRPLLGIDKSDFAWLQALIVDGWIGLQIRYHKQRGHQHLVWHRVLRTGVLVAFAGTLVSALLHVLGGGRATEFLAIALPAIGGALSYIEVHQEHRRHAERYRWTLSRLYELKRRGERADDVHDLRLVMRHMLDLMNTENADWADVMWIHDPELSA